MDILQAFILDNTKYTVQTLCESDDIYFRASDIGRAIGLTNIRATIASYDADEKTMRTIETSSGMQYIAFLTEAGAYKLLMRSDKPAAQAFQKWLTHVVKTIRKEKRYELDTSLQAAAEQARLQTMQSVHDTIVSMYKHKRTSVVYFGFIRTEDDKMLIKVGSTDDLDKRAPQLQQAYGSMLIRCVLECACFRQFERYLHKHPVIAQWRFTEAVNGVRHSHEVFQVTEDEYNIMLGIAKKNRYRFQDAVSVEQILEKQQNDLRLAELQIERDRAIENAAKLALERASMQQTIVVAAPDDRRVRAMGRGTKVQRYSADGKELLKTYVGMTDASRDPALDNPVPAIIRQMANERRVYKGYRWALLERELADDTVQDIGPTAADLPAAINHGYVAMLDLDRTKIVDVFADQTAAAAARQLKGVAAISNAIKRGSKSSGHYFAMWQDCADELKQAYLRERELPPRRTSGQAKPIQQLHPRTQEVVREYATVVEVVKAMRLTRATLYAAIKDQSVLRGHLWRSKP